MDGRPVLQHLRNGRFLVLLLLLNVLSLPLLHLQPLLQLGLPLLEQLLLPLQRILSLGHCSKLRRLCASGSTGPVAPVRLAGVLFLEVRDLLGLIMEGGLLSPRDVRGTWLRGLVSAVLLLQETAAMVFSGLRREHPRTGRVVLAPLYSCSQVG